MSIIITSLAIAFCFVEFIQKKAAAILQILTGSTLLGHKPFTCIKCLTGWIALALGCIEYGYAGLFYLPLGVFTGAIFSAIQMRYL